MYHLFEFVAPATALTAVLLLPFGPILFPRTYILFLFCYFTTYLYISINHFFKFCITVRNVKRNIRQWNATQALRDSTSNNDVAKSTGTSSNSGRTSPTRSGYAPTMSTESVVDEKQYSDMESALRLYEDDHYIHAFVIPNYEEPEALLRDTIKRLAQHRNSPKTHVIVLAMEASEPNHAEKAASLKNAFEGSFLEFVVTVHPKDVPGESRGKGSNVAYAARTACIELLRSGYDKRRVIFTITDSDSAIPELYIRHVEKALIESEDPYSTICSPPIFFSRNAFDVPAAVRVTDIMWSIMVMQNLSNGRGLSFPCSTYSLSMVLAEKVGFWDVDQDAVGEDLHMWLKCFFKTDGAARTAPIFVPINLTNVQTTGYLSNLHARYVQAKRHYNGVADVAYTLKSTFNGNRQRSSLDKESLLLSSPTTPTYFSGSRDNRSSCTSSTIFEKLVVVFHVLEAHMIPATSGWLMFAAVPVTHFLLISTYSPLSIYYPTFQNPIITSEFHAFMFSLVRVIGFLLPVPVLLMASLYEGLHRTVDAELFKKSVNETRTWKNLADYAWLPVSAWLFMTLPSTLACMKRLKKGEEMYVGAKKTFTEGLSH